MAKITPFVKRMRTQGGTIYTFSSALEDIGLNINERNNVVKMSNYALLNIPSIVPIPGPNNHTSTYNTFNVYGIPGAYQSYNAANIKDGRVIVAENFQNYALNLEVNLLDQNTYNPALSTTVSERVFWKWLKETGAIRWTDSSVANGINYWEEEPDTEPDTGIATGYNSVVKLVGQISAGSVRTDTFGTYNETYVLIPTSFGQSKAFFKQVEDDNYYHDIKIENGHINILGRESYLKPHPDGLDFKAYYDVPNSTTIISSDVSMFYAENGVGSWKPGWWPTAEGITPIQNSYYTDKLLSYTWQNKTTYNTYLKYSGAITVMFKRSKVDCLSLEFDLDNLKVLYSDPALTFDKMAIDYAVDNNFNFNSVLIYYSVYNKSLDTILATNLLGVLFLDHPGSGAWPNEIIMPAIEKLQSGVDGFGTSYSFRLNIKSDYMLDDSKAIVDDNTASQTDLATFSEIFDGLNKSLNILNQHTGTINYISNQYNQISAQQTDVLNNVSEIQYQLNAIARDITGTEGTIAMFIAGDDPIGDSSIYMKNGNLGIFANNPKYKVQVDGEMKTKNIILESNIKDINGNVILGYGSPLQLGSSTNKRDIAIYTGCSQGIGTPPWITYPPAIIIDTNNKVYINNFLIGDGSDWVYQAVPNRGFPIIDTQLGTGLTWSNGKIYVAVNDVSGGVSIFYVDGSLAIRDIILTTSYATNVSVNRSFATNVSVNTYYATNVSVNKSFATNVSVNTYYATNVSVNKSFATNASVNTSFAAVNASLNSVFVITSYVNSSTYYDGSINNIRSLLSSSKVFQILTINVSTAIWDISTGYNASIILTTNVSLNIINASSGDSGTLIVKQDPSGNRLLELPVSSYKNSAWTLSTDASAKDIVSFLYDGYNYYWNKGGPYA